MSEKANQLAAGARALRKLHTQWGIAFPHEGVREVLGGSNKFIGTNLFAELEVAANELVAWVKTSTLNGRRELMRRFSRLETDGIAYLRRTETQRSAKSVDSLFAFLWLASGLAYHQLFPECKEEPDFPELAVIPTRERLIQTCSEFFPMLGRDASISDLEDVFQELVRK